MLEVNSISAGYGLKLILREVSFRLAEGTVLALIGPNGSGKTTLIRAVSGVLPLQSGNVRVYGSDISRLHPQKRAN